MSQDLQGYNLLIVSDLHLSEGRDPRYKKFLPSEDFFFDEEFARFLAYYRDQTRWPGKKWHLIINGDFLDFLQVYGHVPDISSLQPGIDPEQLVYGLACGEKETVYKLHTIVDGHQQFFEALAEFIAAGHIVTIIKGNHDVEFHYDEVRAAFRHELRQTYARKFLRDADPEESNKLAQLTDDAIRFSDWFYYEKGLLWVEHGNQYDALNCFKYWLAPLLPALPGVDARRKDDIDLPLGSLFVRYLFNRVETAHPFADNVKPQTKYVFWLISYHPLLALRFLVGSAPYMLGKMARAWRPVKPDAYATRERAHRVRQGQLAAQSGIPLPDLEFLDCQHAHNVLKEPRGRWKLYGWLIRHWKAVVTVVFVLLLLPQLRLLAPLLERFPTAPQWLTSAAGAVVLEVSRVLRWVAAITAPVAALWPRVRPLLRFALKKFTQDQEEKRTLSYLARRAALTCKRLNVRYVVMGHIHAADLERIGTNGEYFNTGTWTKVFRPEEERLIAEESELVFVQAVRQGGGLKVKLLKWYDPANRPRLVKLFM